MPLQLNRSTASPKWVGAIFALVGVGAMAGSWFMAEKQLAILREWPTVEAEVLQSEVTSHRDSDDNSTTYGARVEFHFVVSGVEHKTWADRGWTTSFRSWMQSTADRFSPGSRHPIRYNPAQPTDTRFNAGYSLEFFGVPVFLTGFGLIFLLVGLLVMRAKVTPQIGATTDACPTCQTSAPPGEKFCPKCGTMLHEG